MSGAHVTASPQTMLPETGRAVRDAAWPCPTRAVAITCCAMVLITATVPANVFAMKTSGSVVAHDNAVGTAPYCQRPRVCIAKGIVLCGSVSVP